MRDRTEEIMTKVEHTIKEMVKNSPNKIYREPLVGFAAADDPLFLRLKEVVCPEHLLPSDLLPGAKGVIAFFLPFSEEIITANRQEKFVARQWAVAYIETNKLISQICRKLHDVLEQMGINAAYEDPTHNFDAESLLSVWSHRHVAFIAGLGTFGHHHLLITEKGCAGRFGSIVIDYPVVSALRPTEKYCLRERGESCVECISLCPAKALTENGLDGQRCYKWLLAVDRFYPDLGLSDCCGKCSLGPCAFEIPKAWE